MQPLNGCVSIKDKQLTRIIMQYIFATELFLSNFRYVSVRLKAEISSLSLLF